LLCRSRQPIGKTISPELIYQIEFECGGDIGEPGDMDKVGSKGELPRFVLAEGVYGFPGLGLGLNNFLIIVTSDSRLVV